MLRLSVSFLLYFSARGFRLKRNVFATTSAYKLRSFIEAVSVNIPAPNDQEVIIANRRSGGDAAYVEVHAFSDGAAANNYPVFVRVAAKSGEIGNKVYLSAVADNERMEMVRVANHLKRLWIDVTMKEISKIYVAASGKKSEASTLKSTFQQNGAAAAAQEATEASDVGKHMQDVQSSKAGKLEAYMEERKAKKEAASSKQHSPLSANAWGNRAMGMLGKEQVLEELVKDIETYGKKSLELFDAYVQKVVSADDKKQRLVWSADVTFEDKNDLALDPALWTSSDWKVALGKIAGGSEYKYSLRLPLVPKHVPVSDQESLYSTTPAVPKSTETTPTEPDWLVKSFTMHGLSGADKPLTFDTLAWRLPTRDASFTQVEALNELLTTIGATRLTRLGALDAADFHTFLLGELSALLIDLSTAVDTIMKGVQTAVASKKSDLEKLYSDVETIAKVKLTEKVSGEASGHHLEELDKMVKESAGAGMGEKWTKLVQKVASGLKTNHRTIVGMTARMYATEKPPTSITAAHGSLSSLKGAAASAQTTAAYKALLIDEGGSVNSAQNLKLFTQASCPLHSLGDAMDTLEKPTGYDVAKDACQEPNSLGITELR